MRSQSNKNYELHAMDNKREGWREYQETETQYSFFVTQM